MGSTISINDTILGRSLIQNSFRTLVPFYYTRYRHDDGTYENRAYLSSTNYQYIGRMDNITKIDPGLIFTIIKVDKRWGIDTGVSLNIYVDINKPYDEFLNEVPVIITGGERRDLFSPVFEITIKPDTNGEVNFDIPIVYDDNIIQYIC